MNGTETQPPLDPAPKQPEFVEPEIEVGEVRAMTGGTTTTGTTS